MIWESKASSLPGPCPQALGTVVPVHMGRHRKANLRGSAMLGTGVIYFQYRCVYVQHPEVPWLRFRLL